MIACGRRVAAILVALAALVLVPNLFGRELSAVSLAAPGIDKPLHFVGYLVIFIVVQALSSRFTDVPGRRRLAAAVFGLCLSVGDELVQQFVPGRSFEVFDLVADWAGLTAGWVLTSRPWRPFMLAPATAALLAVAYVSYDTHVRLADYSRGLRFERQHEFVKAREHFQRALARGLRSASLYNELSWVEIESRIGDAVKAVEYAGAALEMQPSNPDILDTYGWALHHAGRHEEALAALEDAYALDPTIYCIHYHLGAVYAALDRDDLAAAHFRRQIALPDTREAVFAKEALAVLEVGR